MAISLESRTKTIHAHRTHDKDTGSTQVQIAMLTQEINSLSEHLQKHVKDHHSRRGLLMKVSRRNRLLAYLHESDAPAYVQLIDKLGLRK